MLEISERRLSSTELDGKIRVLMLSLAALEILHHSDLEADPAQMSEEATDYAAEQCKDDELKEVIDSCLKAAYRKIAREPRLWLVRKHSSRWLMEYSTLLTPRATTGEE